MVYSEKFETFNKNGVGNSFSEGKAFFQSEYGGVIPDLYMVRLSSRNDGGCDLYVQANGPSIETEDLLEFHAMNPFDLYIISGDGSNEIIAPINYIDRHSVDAGFILGFSVIITKEELEDGIVRLNGKSITEYVHVQLEPF